MTGKVLLAASCVAVVLEGDGSNHCLLISYSGGEIGGYNAWRDEFENTTLYIDEIFAGYPQPPNNPGFYVWEGEIEPVHEDQSKFYGKWRPATKEDMAALVKDSDRGSAELQALLY